MPTPQKDDKSEADAFEKTLMTVLDQFEQIHEAYTTSVDVVKAFIERQCERCRAFELARIHGQINFATRRFDSWAYNTDMNDLKCLRHTLNMAMKSIKDNASYDYRVKGLNDSRETCNTITQLLRAATDQNKKETRKVTLELSETVTETVFPESTFQETPRQTRKPRGPNKRTLQRETQNETVTPTIQQVDSGDIQSPVSVPAVAATPQKFTIEGLLTPDDKALQMNKEALAALYEQLQPPAKQIVVISDNNNVQAIYTPPEASTHPNTAITLANNPKIAQQSSINGEKRKNSDENMVPQKRPNCLDTDALQILTTVPSVGRENPSIQTPMINEMVTETPMPVLTPVIDVESWTPEEDEQSIVQNQQSAITACDPNITSNTNSSATVLPTELNPTFTVDFLQSFWAKHLQTSQSLPPTVNTSVRPNQKTISAPALPETLLHGIHPPPTNNFNASNTTTPVKQKHFNEPLLQPQQRQMVAKHDQIMDEHNRMQQVRQNQLIIDHQKKQLKEMMAGVSPNMRALLLQFQQFQQQQNIKYT